MLTRSTSCATIVVPVLEAIIARTLRDVERTGRQVRVLAFQQHCPILRAWLHFAVLSRPQVCSRLAQSIAQCHSSSSISASPSAKFSLMNQICYKKITGAAPVPWTKTGPMLQRLQILIQRWILQPPRAAAASFRMQQALVFTHTKRYRRDSPGLARDGCRLRKSRNIFDWWGRVRGEQGTCKEITSPGGRRSRRSGLARNNFRVWQGMHHAQDDPCRPRSRRAPLP